MGDVRRHDVFAAFLHRQYAGRGVKRIACVADGNGALAKRLATFGFETTIYEVRPRKVYLPPGVNWISGFFTRETPVREDAIVGMHPDEATGEIVIAARKLRIPFAVCPCCVLGPESIGVGSESGWLNKLKRLAAGRAHHTQLAINGKRDVLYGRPL